MMDEYLLEMKVGVGCSVSAPLPDIEENRQESMKR